LTRFREDIGRAFGRTRFELGVRYALGYEPPCRVVLMALSLSLKTVDIRYELIPSVAVQ
jgi:hypothetical protein